MLHNNQGRTLTRNVYSELIACGHGVKGKCWWCNFTKDEQRKKPVIERIEAIEDHLIASIEVIKMLLREALKDSGRKGIGFQGATAPVIAKRIDSGDDADKPSGSHGLAFWMSEDTDTIYQWRDESWIDISFSKPDAGEKRVTDIVYKPSTDDVEITHED